MPKATSQRLLYPAQAPNSDPYRLEALKESAAAGGHEHHYPLLGPIMLRSGMLSVFRIAGYLSFLGFLFIAFTYDFSLREPQLRASVLFSDYRSTHNQMVTPPLEPIGTVVEGTELFYMLPSKGIPVLGILLFFHGCSHGGQDMFRLPEDRIMAMSALKRGLAVLSITSFDRETGCWSEYDVHHLGENKVIDRWITHVKLSRNIPRIGMGASSGGSILFSAYKTLGFQSMASYVMPESFSPEDLVKGPGGKLIQQLPATAFVHMSRDTQTAQSVTKNAATLRSLGVPTQVFPVQPHAFTLEMCDKRLPEIGDRRCHIFLERVHAQYPDILDQNNNILQSYFSGEWKLPLEDSKLDDDLRHYIGAPPTEKGQVGFLQFGGHAWPWAAMVEEISAAYGQHEMTCDHRERVLDFLMTNAKIDFEVQGDGNQRLGLMGTLYQELQQTRNQQL